MTKSDNFLCFPCQDMLSQWGGDEEDIYVIDHHDLLLENLMDYYNTLKYSLLN